MLLDKDIMLLYLWKKTKEKKSEPTKECYTWEPRPTNLDCLPTKYILKMKILHNLGNILYVKKVFKNVGLSSICTPNTKKGEILVIKLVIPPKVN